MEVDIRGCGRTAWHTPSKATLLLKAVCASTQHHLAANKLLVRALSPPPEPRRQIPNLLFRMGAAAMLLSNKASWAGRAKYRLVHNERVHVGQSDEAYT